MKKKARLYQAFTGDAAGLRDVLAEHFKQTADDIQRNAEKGDTYAAGLDNGEAFGYRKAAHFLKKLVINGDEHMEDEPVTELEKMKLLQEAQK